MANNSKKDSIREYLFDTSAFLSLESVKLIDIVITYFEIITTPSVISELTDFAQHNDKLGNIASTQSFFEFWITYYKFIIKHMSLGMRTPAQAAKIQLNLGRNMIIGLIELLRRTLTKTHRS